MPIKRKSQKKPSGKKTTMKVAQKARAFSPLEREILLAKGMHQEEIQALEKKHIHSKEDLRLVGDAATLVQLTGIDKKAAEAVMAWALGSASQVVVESADLVVCSACGKRQPKDYKSGDLCVFCGRQVEPVYSCFWCSTSGPGKFCRSCGAVFVPPGELELAILLKRDGLSKEEIPSRLASLTPEEKEILWQRVRSRR
jgi:hypothetical protein